MLIGYSRVSTKQQDYQTQVNALQQAGCDKLFLEKESALKARPELDKALDFVREGDTFIITTLDRLGRSVHDLWTIAEHLKTKQVHLKVLNCDIDTSKPIGSLMFTMLAAMAEFERALTLKRTQEGREAAKAKGIKFGRKPTVANDVTKLEAIKADVLAAQLTMKEISQKHGISRDRIYKLVGSRESLMEKSI